MASARVKQGNETGNNYWSLIQDTAWDGFEEIPLDIMKGYWTEMYEITQQMGEDVIDVLFLQSGVGSWAASILGYVATQWEILQYVLALNHILRIVYLNRLKLAKEL